MRKSVEASMRASLRATSVRDLPSYREARRTYLAFRRARGYVGNAPLLTPPEAQAKLGKNGAPGWSLTLAPAKLSGLDACPLSGACGRPTVGDDHATMPCVMTSAGKGVLDSVMSARVCRTLFLAEHPDAALAIILQEVKRATADGRRAITLRLNAASDIRWEVLAPWFLAALPKRVRLYDYTKWPMAQRHPERLAREYRIVRSVDERPASLADAERYVREGGSAAVVLDAKRYNLPTSWRGLPMVDGDVTDDRTRPLERGTWIGLAVKGAGIGDDSGFIYSV